MFMNQEAVLTEAFSRISGVALAAGTTLSLEKCRNNAINLQTALLSVYRHLFVYQGPIMTRGHIFCIAPAGDIEEEGVQCTSS